jgi:hypothetical protein
MQYSTRELPLRTYLEGHTVVLFEFRTFVL